MFSIKDKIIVVTGGNGLLGKQMVSAFREQDAIVISADLKCDMLSADDITIDITSERSVNESIAFIMQKYGRIDGWINNAYPRTPDWGNKLEDVPFKSWQSNIDMHLNGYFLCCKIILMEMKKQGYGSLINMASIYGVVGPDFTIYDGTNMTMPAAYSAIKGGLINLSRYLAAYYGPFQVRVNCVSPGGIFDNQPKTFVDNYNKKVPMRRMGDAKDVVAAANFLLSDEAGYITGHNLVVDGGWTCI